MDYRKRDVVTRATRARWVGRNSSPIFRHLWTKVHHVKWLAEAQRLQFATPFSFRLCPVSFRRYLQSCCEICLKF